MRKKNLLELPPGRPESRYGISARWIKENGKNLLAVDIYDGDMEKPEIRIFMGRDRYLTYAGGKWSGAGLRNISWTLSHGIKKKQASRAGAEAVKRFTRLALDPVRCIAEFQDGIRRRRQEESDRKVTDPVDRRMKCVPKLPKDFYRWINQDVFNESRYFFYRKDRKSAEGWCSSCRKEGTVTDPKHGHKGRCPSCGREVQYRSALMQSQIHDSADGAVLQEVKDGFVLRLFSCSRHFHKKGDGWEIKTYAGEKMRIFYDRSFYEKNRYVWEQFKNRGMRWVQSSYDFYKWECVLYSCGLKSMLAGTELWHSGIEILAGGTAFNVRNFLTGFKNSPYMEYLIKSRLLRMAADMLGSAYFSTCGRHIYKASAPVDISAGSLAGFLKTSRNDIRMLAEADAGLKGLEYLQKQRREGKKPVLEHMKFLQHEFQCSAGLFFELAGGTKPGKLIRYIRQCRRTKAKSKEEFLELYRDYLGMAGQLGYDLSNDFVRFPRQLKLRHDQCTGLLQREKAEKEAEEKNRQHEAVRNLYHETQERYGYEYKDMAVTAPKDAGEIVKEGHALHHCVGVYVEKVSKEETTILFVRKKDSPEEPYYTLEVRDGKVMQCRGKYNCAMTAGVQALIRSFTSRVLKKGIKKAG